MSERFAGFRRPNSTDTPDEWYLAVVPNINHLSEMKVIAYIIYKTFGWRKWEDWISLSQFECGQGGADRGCGLSRPAIVEGLERALEHGYIVRRLLCPHCHGEVHKTEKERRPWKNRYDAGYRDVPAVPVFCPHCSRPLRGWERPFYRLAYADDVIGAYDKPQDFLAKYAHHRAENPSSKLGNSSSELENSSPQLENPSSELENSSSPSPIGPSTRPSTTSATGQKGATDAVVLPACLSSQNPPGSAGDPVESEPHPPAGDADNGVAANLRAMAEYGVAPTRAMREAAARPGMTPDLIHAWAQHVQNLGTVHDPPAMLASVLPHVDGPPTPGNGNGRRSRRRPGGCREGTWTDDELNQPKAQALATCPLHAQYGCADFDEYNALSEAERDLRWLHRARYVADWAKKQTGQVAEAIREQRRALWPR